MTSFALGRPRVRLTGIPWVTWRQHRAALVGLVALFGGLGALMIATGLSMRRDRARLGLDRCADPTAGACAPSFTLFDARWEAWAQFLPRFLMFLPAVVGVFIGAPLVARELESGTFRFAWTQGRSRLRWTGGKLLLLGAAVAFLGAVLRHTVQAMAATAAAWLAVAWPATLWLRPRIQAPVAVPEDTLMPRCGAGRSTAGTRTPPVTVSPTPGWRSLPARRPESATGGVSTAGWPHMGTRAGSRTNPTRGSGTSRPSKRPATCCLPSRSAPRPCSGYATGRRDLPPTGEKTGGCTARRRSSRRRTCASRRIRSCRRCGCW